MDTFFYMAGFLAFVAVVIYMIRKSRKPSKNKSELEGIDVENKEK